MLNQHNNLVSLLQYHAAEKPNEILYRYINDEIDNPITLSYQELDHQARVVGATLLEHCQKGDRALMLYPPGLEFIVAFFACLYAGIVAVPAYPPRKNQKLDRLQSIIQDAGASIVLTTKQCSISARPLFESDAKLNFLPWYETDVETMQKPLSDNIQLSPKTLAFLQYTSGSTGDPKGVMVNHSNLISNLSLMYESYGNNDQSVVCSWLPHFHDMGLMGGVLQGVYGGLPVILMSPSYFLQKPIRWLQVISHYGATFSGGPNFSYDLCINTIDDTALEALDLSSWKIACNGAEPINPATLETFSKKFKSCGFRAESHYPCYGMAETTLLIASGNNHQMPTLLNVDAENLKTGKISLANANTEKSQTIVSNGYARMGHKLQVVDPVSNEALPNDQVGEIWVQGPSVTQGYWRLEEKTKTTFQAYLKNEQGNEEGPYLRTGDLGFIHQGEIYICGREKDLIIIRGSNYYPQDIEQVAQLSHPDLSAGATAAFSITTMHDEKLIVVQEIKRSALRRLDAKAIFGKISSAISQTFGLSVEDIILLKPGRILKTSSGKIKRQGNKKTYEQQGFEPLASWKDINLPAVDLGKHETSFFSLDEMAIMQERDLINYLNSKIVTDIALLLQINDQLINSNQALLSLGFDSLKLTQFASILHEQYQYPITIKELFEIDSIEQLLEDLVAHIKQSNHKSYECIKASGKKRFPLSSSQERLWFLDQYEEQSNAYRLSGLLHIEGKLNINALSIALNSLIDRHEVLRSNFIIEDNTTTPLQRVGSKKNFLMKTIKINNHEIYQQTDKELLVPFDLEKDILFRATLYQVSDKKNYLLINMHHIISDGWSMPIIIKEITATYQSYIRNESNKLKPLSLQYGDYALWQKEKEQQKGLEDNLNYWRRQLNALPTLEFPTSYPRPIEQNHKSNSISFTLSESLSNSIIQLSKDNNATVFMTTLSAFALLINRYSGQQDIAIGTPIANRERTELEELIGFFVNTLVLRFDLSKNEPYKQWLKTVKETTLEAFEHQDAPFEKVVDAVSKNRDRANSPLFQVMFILQNTPLLDMKLDNLDINLEILPADTVKFDLTLTLTETERGLSGTVEYADELFSQGFIESLIGHYKTLLNHLVSNTSQQLSEIKLLTKDENHQLLIENNKTAINYPDNKTIHQLFEEQRKKTPDHIAVQYENQQLTYNQLNEKANQLAHDLIAKGIEPEDLVAICLQRSLDMMVGLLAILKAGAAYVPIDPQYPQDRIRYMLNDSAAKIVLTQSDLINQLPGGNYQPVAIDRCQLYHQPCSNPDIKISSNHLAYVIYTSGSTGQPKGVMIEHKSACNFLFAARDEFVNDKLQAAVVSTSLAFDATVQSFYVPLISGMYVELLSESIPMIESLAKCICSEEPLLFKITPSHLRAINHIIKTEKTIETAHVMVIGGEKLTIRMLDQWSHEQLPNITLINEYGPTEATVGSTTYTIDSSNYVDSSATSIAIGKPLPNVNLYILDKHKHLTPQGIPGELYIAGAGLARGYLNNPSLTAEKFIDNPFNPGNRLYKTGDIVRYREDGNIEYIGRMDDQVKIRGFRIELGEIEKQLVHLDDIKEAIVLAKNTSDYDQALVAYVVANKDIELDIAQVKSKLSLTLPDYMLPNAILSIDAIPLTPNGKADKKAINELDVQIKTGVNYVAASNDIENKLVALYEDILNIERVGINDNFFDLGGHSLLATQLISRIRQVLNVDLTLKTFFSAPTVSGLANSLNQHNQSVNDQKIPKLTDLTALPLSFTQERLWFLNQYEAGSTTYHMPGLLSLVGELNHSALEHALITLIDRHESLRSNFIVDKSSNNNTPYQKIGSADRFYLSEKTICKSNLRKQIDVDLQQTFDLRHDLLFRANLYKISDQHNYLLINMHHIVSDGWSISIIIKEIAALYNAYHTAQKNPLQALNIQYSDYAAWQKAQLKGDRLEKKLAYWKEQLHAVPVLELPTTYPRPAQQNYHGKTIDFTIDIELTNAIKKLSRQHDVTLFMTLLGAFGILMSRYSSQDDIAIGTPIANRERPELENLIGFFVNTLVLRLTFPEGLSFNQYMQKVKETTLDAYTHQDTPFEKVVDALSVTRNRSHSPLFQVMFVLQNTPQSAPSLDGLNINRESLSQETSKFDITLNLTETEIGLKGSLEYATDLFSKDFIESLIGHYQTLLQEIVNDYQKPIVEYNILTPSEHHQLIVENNQTKAVYPQNKAIHQLFEQQVEKTPVNTAVIFESQQLSYLELNKKANQLAHHLIKQGIQTDNLVAICVDRSLDMIIGLLAILKAGAAYVPIDPSYPKERIDYMLEDSDARWILTQSHLQEQLSLNDAYCITIDTLSTNTYSSSNPCVNIQSDQLAYVIYTSGSTGKPKGVMIQHNSLCNFLHSMKTCPGLSIEDNLLAVTPISFDIHTLELYLPLIVGARLTIASRSVSTSPLQLSDLINSDKITVMQATPATWQMLLNNNWKLSQPLKALCGGEAITDELKMRLLSLPNLTLHNMYGPTETTVWSSTTLMDTHTKTSIGRPINNTQFYLLDKHLQPVPYGITGQLHIAGAGLARGYLNRPNLTTEKFIDNPFDHGSRMYKTGDLARLHSDGTLEYISRVDNQVKIRGFRIELGEIEQQLRQLKGVKEAVVVTKDTEHGDQAIVSYVVAADDEKEAILDIAHIKLHLGQKMPSYMLPNALVCIDMMPLTANGKIDKKALQARPLSINQQSNYVPASNEQEKRLASIWQEVLSLKSVGIHDNFFDLGGHSLLAVNLITKTNQALGTDIPLNALFQYSTIAGLLNALEQGLLQEKSPNIVAINTRKNNHQPPLFLVAGIGGNTIGFYPLAQHLGENIDVYSLEPKGLDGKSEPLTNMQSLARFYIQLVKKVQPQGPYHFAGHSFGGHVIYEMARQLEQSGESVAQLMILDSIAPTLATKKQQLPSDDIECLCYQLELLGQLHDIDLSLDIKAARDILPENINLYTKNVLQDRLNMALSITSVRGFLSVMKSQLSMNYYPDFEQYTGPITVFHANDLTSNQQSVHPLREQADLGWKKFTTAKVNSIKANGGHMSMLGYPFVESIAKQITDLMVNRDKREHTIKRDDHFIFNNKNNSVHS